MPDTPTRRRILQILGSTTALVGIGAASGDEEQRSNTTTTQEQRVTFRQEQTISGDIVDVEVPGGLTTLGCGEWPDFQDEHGQAVEGKIELCNCSPCTRTVTINVTGKVYGPHLATVDGSRTVHIESDTAVTYYYTGSLDGLEMSEPSDMNVAISQRSLHESNSSTCSRGCERC